MKSFLKNYPPAAWPILFIALIGMILMLVWPALTSQAGPDLPERPPIEKPGEGGDDDGRDDITLSGAYIELQVQPGQPGLWTAVEWQDSAGGWQVVEGWRGTLDADGRRAWWVAPADFKTGPFRWAVYQGPDGPLLATSQPFHLPAENGQVTQVVMSLAE